MIIQINQSINTRPQLKRTVLGRHDLNTPTFKATLFSEQKYAVLSSKSQSTKHNQIASQNCENSIEKHERNIQKTSKLQFSNIQIELQNEDNCQPIIYSLENDIVVDQRDKTGLNQKKTRRNSIIEAKRRKISCIGEVPYIPYNLTTLMSKVTGKEEIL